MKAARLVVLTVAIAAGGVAALLAGRSEKPPEPKPVAAAKPDTIDILVAKGNIPLGHRLTPGDIAWQAWPATTATGNFIRKPDRPAAIEQLSGQMAAILPSGMRAVATQITPESSAGGFILPNDHVDVILSRRDKAAEKAGGVEVHTSEIILSNVRVLAIDQNVEEKNGQKVVVGKTATLELAPDQVETLALAQQVGQLSLALRSITDASAKDAPIEKRKTGVNIVRFGVGTMTTPR
jgi:pilus assembly protein CpaB